MPGETVLAAPPARKAPLLTVRVAARTREAEDVVALELIAADGEELPAFTAGAHLDVHIPGIGIRQYSLINPETEQHRYRIAMLRTVDSRGGSTWLHEAVTEGDRLSVGQPRNLFPLAPEMRHGLLLAGGIGITPILCMADALDRRRIPFELHYCARSASRMAFRDTLTGSGWAHRVRLHLDDGPLDQRLDLRTVLASQPADTHLYVCGPAGFIGAVLDSAASQGWATSHLHWERFSSAETATAADACNTSFVLRIEGSPHTLNVPSDKSALAVLRDAGFPVESSCEQGICGACVLPVVEGIPDHRDGYFLPEERARNDRFTPCCSRARTTHLTIRL